MENPRADKVAIVEEVQQKLSSADAMILTEYRGIDVPGLATLRASLREAGGEYKIYKNNLVKIAAQNIDLDISEHLVGPTAIAFVDTKPDGQPGDAVMVAKALKSFSKDNPALIVKGGMLGDVVLTASDASALAEIAPREELLSRLAGGLAAPMQQMAALLAAVPQKMAYALQALIQEGGASDAPPAAPAGDDDATSAGDEPAADATPTPDAAEAADAPEAEVADATDATEEDAAAAPAAEAETTEDAAADSSEETEES